MLSRVKLNLIMDHFVPFDLSRTPNAQIKAYVDAKGIFAEICDISPKLCLSKRRDTFVGGPPLFL